MTNALEFHADHHSLMAEAHARPSIPLSDHSSLLHVAFNLVDAAKEQLISNLGIAKPDQSDRYYRGKLNNLDYKLELHTEFVSLTLFGSAKYSCDDLFNIFSQQLNVAGLKVIALLKIRVIDSAKELLKSLPSDQFIYGGSIKSSMSIRSTYKPDDDGAISIVLHSNNQTSEELGRRVKRLLEMETYRTMSLMGLPLARSVSTKLSEFEDQLEQLSSSLREKSNDTNVSEQELFDRLIELSEKNNVLASECRYRFSASRAYYDLFIQRIASLSETIEGDLQSLSGFLRSRADPAMATIDSVAKRQQTITDDISRALSLLRARIELTLNKDNQKVLASMERRHTQHLKIARSVEGLSVVAISYYAVGLFSYFTKAIAKQEWLFLPSEQITALAVPVIVFFVWFGLHKLREGWGSE